MPENFHFSYVFIARAIQFHSQKSTFHHRARTAAPAAQAAQKFLDSRTPISMPLANHNRRSTLLGFRPEEIHLPTLPYAMW